MTNRRDFLKQAAMLSGSTGLASFVPSSILRAMALNPAPGSTYLDAEHIVVLMQENRGFDHCYGSLKGVRGFNDPRVTHQPNGNPVWLQTNKDGFTYAPFRLDIRRTKATWMGDVPHSRHTQVDAFNKGDHDNWLESKRSSNPKYKDIPLTMGYYTRQDIPFYYALADAFTVCDQNFASAMTSTHPNRLFLWTGTIREQQAFGTKANIRNTDSANGKHKWKTFPERLEENNISWKFYQNDLTAGGGLTGEERSWLTNFGCNPLEWFQNYNVKFFDRYVAALTKQTHDLPVEIEALKKKWNTASAGEQTKITADLDIKRKVLATARIELEAFSKEKFDALPEQYKQLHQRGFTTNKDNPDYRSITEFSYHENGQEHSATMPKGDVLHQFRKDVNEGRLPAVSWLTSPQKFSDHPSAPWYGAWMISEVLDILTQKPEVWKKTIFILTYDENDGYFDHQPPFTAAYPGKPRTGKCSGGIDTGVEHITREEELQFGEKPNEARGGPVGLGFRVPMVVASPWSRGGKVCSQVFDHTSVIRFMEQFFAAKSGKDIRETNISSWRRTVCGDLTAVFSPFDNAETKLPFIKQKEFLESINSARLAPEPNNFRSVSPDEMAALQNGKKTGLLPKQEPGVRRSCALPYELGADGYTDNGVLTLSMRAGNKQFGARSAGAPFKVYVDGGTVAGKKAARAEGYIRDYAVAAGDSITDDWKISDFTNDAFSLRLHGPNGFFRAFTVKNDTPALRVSFEQVPGGLPRLVISANGTSISKVRLVHNSYGYPTNSIALSEKTATLPVDLSRSHGWYDFSVIATGYEARYAGRIESGRESFSDPLLGI